MPYDKSIFNIVECVQHTVKVPEGFEELINTLVEEGFLNWGEKHITFETVNQPPLREEKSENKEVSYMAPIFEEPCIFAPKLGSQWLVVTPSKDALECHASYAARLWSASEVVSDSGFTRIYGDLLTEVPDSHLATFYPHDIPSMRHAPFTHKNDNWSDLLDEMLEY